MKQRYIIYMDFNNYLKIKDRCCIYYFGHDTKYITQLKEAYPMLESKFPELQIYLSCKDIYFSMLSGSNTLPESKFNPDDYNYVYQILYNFKNNPVFELLEDK